MGRRGARLVVDTAAGDRFAAFLERYIVHTKGRWARQPFVLEDWQRQFWDEALSEDPETGLRVYSEVGLGIPRKNGKSMMAAGAAHYFLVGDGEDEPEVYVAAAARHQAGIVLGQSRRIGLTSPRLRPHVHVGAHIITCPANGGILRGLSADAALQHGLNPSANIIDELHAHKSGDLFTALTTGTGARVSPFTLWITTAGAGGGGILDDILDGAWKTGVGETEELADGFLRIYRDRPAGVLIYWYSAPQGTDPADPEVWAAANPASWLQDGSVLGKAHARMTTRGASAEFRTFHLNQRLPTASPWMAEKTWAAGAGAATLSESVRSYAVARVSHDHRSAAIAIAQKDSKTGRVRVRVTTYPAHALAEGETLSLDAIEAELIALRAVYPAKVVSLVRYRSGAHQYHRAVPGPELGLHGAFTEATRQRLSERGAAVIDLPSSTARLTPAAESVASLLGESLLEHDGGTELAYQMSRLTAKADPRGWRINWLSGADVSAAQALLLAVDRALHAEKPSGKRMRAL